VCDTVIMTVHTHDQNPAALYTKVFNERPRGLVTKNLTISRKFDHKSVVSSWLTISYDGTIYFTINVSWNYKSHLTTS